MIDIHKEKCKQLMKIRKIMADKLGVDLHQRECTFEGKCSGTCPKCKQEEEILNKAILQRTVAAGVATTMGVSMVGCSISNKDNVSLTNSIQTNTTEENTQQETLQKEELAKPIVTHIQNDVNEVNKDSSNIETASYIDVSSLFENNDNKNITTTPTINVTPTSVPTLTSVPTPTSILEVTSTPQPTNAPAPNPTKEPIIINTPNPTNEPTPSSTPKPTKKPIPTSTPTPIATITPIIIPDPTGNVIGDDDEIITPTPTPSEAPPFSELTGLVVVDPITPTPNPDDGDDDDVPGPIAPGLTGNVEYIPTPTPTKVPFAAPLTGMLKEN